jgi:nucleoside-diphosphate-sugar epimerase
VSRAVILGGNNFANYLSIELEKFKFETYHLSRKFKKKLPFKKNIKLINYEFNNFEKKLNEIDPKIIINLISYTGNDLKKAIKINSILPSKIIKYSIKKKISLILIGSSSEYGSTKKKKIPETNILKPISVYGYSKSLQSKRVKKINIKQRKNILLFRVFNLSGNISDKNTLMGKVNNFISRNNKNKKKKILNLGNLSSFRDFIDIVKASKIIVKLIVKKKYGIFNLGSGKSILVRKMIKKLFKKHKNLSFNELVNKMNKNKLQYSCADLNKLNKALNEKN